MKLFPAVNQQIKTYSKQMFALLAIGSISLNSFAQSPTYHNSTLTIDNNVKDLIPRITLEDKEQQMTYNSPAIPRLNSQAYNGWNKRLYGVARSGTDIISSQAIGLNTSFNNNLALGVTYQAPIKKENYLKFGSLTFWVLDSTIYREHLRGREQNTYRVDAIAPSASTTFRFILNPELLKIVNKLGQSVYASS